MRLLACSGIGITMYVVWAVALATGDGAATTRPATTGPASEPALAQGIHGRVIKLVGDFTVDPPLGERRPISVPVHCFRGKVKPFEKPDLKHPALVKVLQPDTAGRFTIALPPGEYTLVADLNGRLYLNNWLEDGSWATVTVRAGQWTEFTLENVLEATF